MGAFSLTHFAVLWSCLKAYGHAKRLRIPMLIAAAVVMFYNRHMDSWMDDSPFGGTLTMYDQQIIGLCGYLRVFDNPNEEFGSLEFDLAGLFVGVEVLVFVTFLLGVCLCVYDRLATVIRRSRRPTCFLPEEIPPPITAGDAAQ